MSGRGEAHLLFCMCVSANCAVNIILPACGSAEILKAFMQVRGGAGICKYSSIQTEPQLSEGAMVIVPEPLSVSHLKGRRTEKDNYWCRKVIEVASSLMCRPRSGVEIQIPFQSPSLLPRLSAVNLGHKRTWLDPAEYIN